MLSPEVEVGVVFGAAVRLPETVFPLLLDELQLPSDLFRTRQVRDGELVVHDHCLQDEAAHFVHGDACVCRLQAAIGTPLVVPPSRRRAIVKQEAQDPLQSARPRHREVCEGGARHPGDRLAEVPMSLSVCVVSHRQGA
jgi:hypothetical protein